MEPRTTTAEYDTTTGHYTLYAGSGRGVAKLRLDLAQVLGVPAEQVRCVCRDMGGNFGTRNFFYPEYALLAWAARRVGRPLKWTCERSDAFLSDYQGRDLTVEAELALDEEGNFLAVRGSNLSNLGGHAAAFVSLQKGLGLMSNVYRIPVGYFRVVGDAKSSPTGSDCYVQRIDRNIDPHIIRLAHLRTPSLLMRARALATVRVWKIWLERRARPRSDSQDAHGLPVRRGRFVTEPRHPRECSFSNIQDAPKAVLPVNPRRPAAGMDLTVGPLRANSPSLST
jgi:hypothetical protein